MSSDDQAKKDRKAGSSNGAAAAGNLESPSAPAGAQEPSLDDELNGLREALAQKEREAGDNYDRFLRATADLENFKKRARREHDERARFAVEPLVRDLLPVVENLDRAVGHAAGGGNGAPLVEGVTLVLKSLQEVLKRYGVTVVDAAPGEIFDPVRHEAVARAETDGEPNRIVNQHERGYFLHERLLRPAKVVVSCAKPPDESLEKPDNDD